MNAFREKYLGNAMVPMQIHGFWNSWILELMNYIKTSGLNKLSEVS